MSDDLPNPRQLKAAELASSVVKGDGFYTVTETSESGELVESRIRRDENKKILCNCDDFISITKQWNKDFRCEHIMAVAIYANRLKEADKQAYEEVRKVEPPPVQI